MGPLEASRLVTDEYSAKILISTSKRPMTVQEIARVYKIPVAVCYRRTQTLLDVGLLTSIRTESAEGSVTRYESNLRNAYIFFENGRLRARFQLRSGLVSDFGGDWRGDSERAEGEATRARISSRFSTDNEPGDSASADETPTDEPRDARLVAEKALDALDAIAAMCETTATEIRRALARSDADKHHGGGSARPENQVRQLTGRTKCVTRRRTASKGHNGGVKDND